MNIETYAKIQLGRNGHDLSYFLNEIDNAEIRICATAEGEDDEKVLASIADEYKLDFESGSLILDCLSYQWISSSGYDSGHEHMTFTDECGNDVEALRHACELALEEDDLDMALQRISETFGIPVEEIEHHHADIIYADRAQNSSY